MTRAMFQFSFPWAFVLLLLPVVLLVATRKTRSPLLAFKYFGAVPLKDIPTSLRSASRRIAMRSLWCCCWLAAVIAFARPQTVEELSEVEESGRDIMLVLDTSGSMQAIDFKIDGEHVSRLTALKSVVRDFISKRSGDRVGLVVFGDEAFSLCPLTLDHSTLVSFLDTLEPGMAGGRTAIGDGLAVGLKRMEKLPAKSKVMVLVTDGDNTAGSLSPLQAAKAAAGLGVRVHTIGIGKNGPAPVPQRTVFGNTVIVQMAMKIDEETLKKIASISGGEYFNANNTESLKEIYQRIDNIEMRLEKRERTVAYTELFPIPLTASVVLLVLTALLQYTVFRRLP